MPSQCNLPPVAQLIAARQLTQFAVWFFACRISGIQPALVGEVNVRNM